MSFVCEKTSEQRERLQGGDLRLRSKDPGLRDGDLGRQVGYSGEGDRLRGLEVRVSGAGVEEHLARVRSTTPHQARKSTRRKTAATQFSPTGPGGGREWRARVTVSL